MSARKRKNDSRTYEPRNGGQTTARAIAALFLCAVMSFAVGFFVLARFWTASGKSDTGAGASAAVSPASSDNSPTPEPSAPSAAPHDPGTARPQPAAPVDGGAHPPAGGPAVGPANDDTQAAHTPDDGDGAKFDPAKDPQAKDQPDNEFAGKKGVDDSAPNPDAPATDDTRPKHRRKRHPADDSQPMAGPDAGKGGAATENGADNPPAVEPSARPKAGLYRVQIGVYSTRERAEAEAKRANDKGFATTVQSVPSGDRTLYRIQHSAYRSRANAEIEKQKLVDAGFDASIADPGD